LTRLAVIKTSRELRPTSTEEKKRQFQARLPTQKLHFNDAISISFAV
jgi:hypothetical protein